MNRTDTIGTMDTTAPARPAGTARPAGVGTRLLATFIDGLIMAAVRWPLSFLLVIPVGLLAQRMDPAMGGMISLAVQLVDAALGLVIAFFYVGWFYKNKGATPGKMLFKLKVVDMETGTHLGYGRAFLRDIVGKFLSAITLFVGYIMAFFREDRRALHDLLAGTQVIRKD